jgi:hypothetical protein
LVGKKEREKITRAKSIKINNKEENKKKAANKLLRKMKRKPRKAGRGGSWGVVEEREEGTTQIEVRVAVVDKLKGHSAKKKGQCEFETQRGSKGIEK